MADHRSFAIVTAALHALTQSAVEAIMPGTAVRIGPPRASSPGEGAAGEAAVTLTLYHLAENTAFRAVPARRPDPSGTLRPPPVAFDLHYMLSVAGGERLASERLLGALAAAFAVDVRLTPAMLAAVCAADGAYPELAAPDTAAPPPTESVRLSPHYPTPAEAAALWSGLFAIAHQPSLHLIASPVLIAIGDTPRPPLPVTERDPNL